MEVCKDCGEKGVIEDLENGRSVRVCTECGVMQNDVQEYVTIDYREGTTISDGQARGPKGVKTGVRSGPKKGKVFGAENISRIGKCLGANVDMISEATSLYNRVFDRELNKTISDTKLAMCGACLYTIGRQHGRGFGVKDVCKFLDIHNAGKRLSKALKVLRNKFDIRPPALPVSSETDHLLAQTDFSPEICKLTHDIMSLCERYWLSQGRSNSITFSVAVYFAWRACNFPNPNLDFPAFCKKYAFNLTPATKGRRAEVEKLLRTAIQKIPWLKGKKIRAVDPYIKDAVTFQASLMQETLESGALNIKPSDQASTSQGTEKLQCDTKLATVFRKHGYTEKKVIPEEAPSVKLSKNSRSAAEQLESDSDVNMLDLGSDDDTDLYIRSSEEVDNLKKLHGKVKELQEV